MNLTLRNGTRIQRFSTASISLLEKPVEKIVHISNQVVTFDGNSQLRNLINSGNLQAARQVFDKMPHRDVFSWTAIIKGYVTASNPEEALALFSAMRINPTVFPDTYVLSVAFKACGESSNLAYGETLHGYAEKTYLLNSVYVGSSLLDMYKRIGKTEEFRRVFDEMPYRNLVTWTTIITGLVHAGRYKEALIYFSEMSRSEELPDTFTFASALKACAESRGIKQGKEIHTHVIVRGFSEILCVSNSLANMYTECGEMRNGLRVFERMNEKKDVVSWTSLIVAYTRIGQEEKAMEIFVKMRNSEVLPNEQTFASMFSACASLCRLAWGEQLHGNVFSVGYSDSLSVSNSMMKMYSSCGELDSVSSLFRGMSWRDVISWSTVIGGYSQAGFVEESFKYFSLMRLNGPKPTDFALASLLSVSGTMLVIEQGKQVHALAFNLGLDQRSTIRSALISMYSKCGNIEEASKVMESSVEIDIVSLTAMINGFAEHGKCQEGVNLFENSLKLGLKPDSVTFISVLTACAHSGQVELGFCYFNSMQESYDIKPEKEHYGCMVDLLCRAGRIIEAEKMINEMMPGKKDDVVWTVLLTACLAKGDIERGKRAAEKILELDPNSTNALVTLANIYASTRKWEEVANVRKKMKSKGMIKDLGWSKIEINGQDSTFGSGDRGHTHSEDIYNVLELVISNAEEEAKFIFLL